jgi:hypothetical protein
MALGKVIRELGVKISLAFDKGKVDQAKKSIDEVGIGLKDMAKQVAAASSALLGIAAISSNNSRKLEQNSAALGINVERLQELEYAAKVAAGISRDELGGALEGLSKTLFEARSNNVQAAQTLIRLGVPLEMISDKSITADQLLLNLSERFKQMPDGIYKTALANEAFGGSGAKLIPLLNKGALGIANMGKEARNLGVILGKGAIAEGAEFDRQLSKVWIVLKNITYVIGGQLIKYLTPLVFQFQKFIVQNKQFLSLGIATAVKSLGIYLGVVFKTVGFLAERFKYLINVLGGLERVSKGIALSFGIFTGLKLVASLGTLLKSFRAIGAVMGVLNVQSLLIGAAFAGLFLIIQDWFSDDSLIKEWIEDFKDEFPNVIKGVGKAFQFVKGVLSDVASAFQVVYEWITKSIGAVGDFGKSFTVAGIAEKVKGAFSGVSDFIGKGVNGALSYFGGGATATASPAITNNKGATTTNMSATINVSVPPGTGAADATNIVSGGVEKGFDAILRQTRNQAIGGVAY